MTSQMQTSRKKQESKQFGELKSLEVRKYSKIVFYKKYARFTKMHKNKMRLSNALCQPNLTHFLSF